MKNDTQKNINTHTTKNGLQIDVIARVRYPGYIVYKVEITNTAEKKTSYDLSRLESRHGQNVCQRQEKILINNMTVLTKGHLDPDEKVAGLICFQPTDFYSSTHEFRLDGEKFKARHKKEEDGNG